MEGVCRVACRQAHVVGGATVADPKPPCDIWLADTAYLTDHPRDADSQRALPEMGSDKKNVFISNFLVGADALEVEVVAYL